MDQPETRFTKSPDGLHIAYQTLGEGPTDVVVLAWLSSIDMYWTFPPIAHLFGRLADVGRLILLDVRGVGASDAVPLGALPTPEAWADDVRVVLDTVGSTKVNILAHSFGGFLGLLFAATYPERTSSLILMDSFARALQADDYPIGLPLEFCEGMVAFVEAHWGSGDVISQAITPSQANDLDLRQQIARWERAAMSRGSAAAYMRWGLTLDVRSVLPAVRAPTLVIHHEQSHLVPVSFSEYLAEHIDGAQLKVIPGSDFFAIRQDIGDDVIDEIQEFVSGAPPLRAPDRAFATILFTDIVSSTARAAELGDHKWRQLLDQHDRLVARELERHRGRMVNTTGDGVVARFDGPARAVRCAQAIVEAARPLGIELRAGLHAGEVEVRREDIGGIAVHIGQRVSALAGPGEVLVSRTVTDLVVGSGLQFADRGEHELKGVPGKWALYAVTP